MQTGAITTHIDVAQIVLYAFFLFFFGLVVHLLRESKREGFPLVRDGAEPGSFEPGSGWSGMPSPKTYLLSDGHTVTVPRYEAPQTVAARMATHTPGAPLLAHGDPMADGLGSAAYANRADHPDMTFDDHLPKIVPLRVATDFFLATEDPDPRGYEVVGADHAAAGVVTDVWIDRSEVVCRYLEVELTAALGVRSVLLGMNDAQIDARARRVSVPAITAAQFAGVPGLKHPDSVTLLEEDKITAYYAGGDLYATPGRAEPLL